MDDFLTSLITASSIVFAFLVSLFFKEWEVIKDKKLLTKQKYKVYQSKLDAYRILCHCLYHSRCVDPYRNKANRDDYVLDESADHPKSFIHSLMYVSRGIGHITDKNNLEEEYDLQDLTNINECCYSIYYELNHANDGLVEFKSPIEKQGGISKGTFNQCFKLLGYEESRIDSIKHKEFGEISGFMCDYVLPKMIKLKRELQEGVSIYQRIALTASTLYFCIGCIVPLYFLIGITDCTKKHA